MAIGIIINGKIKGKEVSLTIIELARRSGVTEYFVRKQYDNKNNTNQQVINACINSMSKKNLVTDMARSIAAKGLRFSS